MKVFLILAHPEPKSFNGALFDASKSVLQNAGHEIRESDLYRSRFNPVSGRHNFMTSKDDSFFKQQIEEIYATEHSGFSSEIEAELEKLEWCDLMIWQFPLWWFGLPAVLKGWADRVLAMGRTYGSGRFYQDGVFRGRQAMLSLTTGGPPAAYAKGGFNGDIESILRPIQRGILEFVGFSVLRPHIVYGPAHSSGPEREEALAAYAIRLVNLHAEEPYTVGQY